MRQRFMNIKGCLIFVLCLLPASPARGEDIHILANEIYPRFLYTIEKFYQERLEAPSGIFVDKAAGEIYVADNGGNTVFVFDESGKPLFKFGREQGISSPEDVVVRDGKIYVSQGGKNYLEVFNYRGEPVKKITPADLKFSPGRLTLDDEGNLYVVNKADITCLVFDREDRLKLGIGKNISSLGGVTVYKDEVFFLTPFDVHSISVYAKDGRYMREFGESGGMEGQFGLPSAIKADERGILWIVDALRGISAFYSDGRKILDYANYGREKGQLYFPIDIDIDRANNIYILEMSMKRVSVFRTGK